MNDRFDSTNSSSLSQSRVNITRAWERNNEKYSIYIVAEPCLLCMCSHYKFPLWLYSSSLFTRPRIIRCHLLSVVSINVVHMNRLWNYNQSITLNHRKSDLLLQCIKPMKLLNWKKCTAAVAWCVYDPTKKKRNERKKFESSSFWCLNPPTNLDASWRFPSHITWTCTEKIENLSNPGSYTCWQ